MVKPKWIQPLTKNAKVRMCLVTSSGWGKTVFSGTAPNALFLTTDPEGTLSASRSGSTAEEWRITSWQDEGGLTKAYEWLADNAGEYDWVIHDNATEEQQLAMGQSIEARMTKRPDGERFVPEKADYQKSQNAFIDITKRFMAIPVHQIWTVHRVLRETDDGIEFFSANIQGQQGAIAEQFLGYMNIIGMGEVTENKAGEQVRRLYLDHYQQYRGKDRYKALGRFQDNLTVPKMMEIIAEGGAPARRTVRKTTTATRRRRSTTA